MCGLIPAIELWAVLTLLYVMQADTTKLALVFRSETEVFETRPDIPMSRYLGSTVLVRDTWVKVVIPEGEFRGHAFDRFHLKNTGDVRFR